MLDIIVTSLLFAAPLGHAQSSNTDGQGPNGFALTPNSTRSKPAPKSGNPPRRRRAKSSITTRVEEIDEPTGQTAKGATVKPADLVDNPNHNRFMMIEPAVAGDAAPKAPTKAESSHLNYAEALQLFSKFGPQQIPNRTKFKFNGFTIPKGSICSDTRTLTTATSKAECTACRAKGASKDEEVRLKTYTLANAKKGFGTKTYTLGFDLTGSPGPISFKCSDVGGEETLPAFADALKVVGVDLDFSRPGEARLVTQPTITPGGARTSN